MTLSDSEQYGPSEGRLGRRASVTKRRCVGEVTRNQWLKTRKVDLRELSEVSSHPISTFISPSPGARALGGVSSGGGKAPRCPCGGERDLHLLAACRASRLFGANNRLREVGAATVPALGHGVVTRLDFATHPSTAHLQSTVLCSSPHHAHLGEALCGDCGRQNQF